jgi:hypothetical protein
MKVFKNFMRLFHTHSTIPDMKSLLTIAVLFACSMVVAQTKTTEALHKKNEEAFSLFFYNNTLRMLNQSGDKSFDELIKDIQKMKFLMIDKKASFTSAEYKKLTSGYKSEKFEEIMTSRYQGKNFDIFLKDASGKTEGMVVLVNDSSSLIVLDIVGSIALNKVTDLYKTLDNSTDIGQKIKSFTKKNDPKSKENDDEDDN